MLSIGSRAQVMHGNAKKTSGGLTKSQLKYNKQGKIVSKKASALAKKNNRLVKAVYVTRKGVFWGGAKTYAEAANSQLQPKKEPKKEPNGSAFSLKTLTGNPERAAQKEFIKVLRANNAKAKAEAEAKAKAIANAKAKEIARIKAEAEAEAKAIAKEIARIKAKVKAKVKANEPARIEARIKARVNRQSWYNRGWVNTENMAAMNNLESKIQAEKVKANANAANARANAIANAQKFAYYNSYTDPTDPHGFRNLPIAPPGVTQAQMRNELLKNKQNMQDNPQGSQKVKLRIHKIETLSCRPYKNSTLYTIQVHDDPKIYQFKYNDIKSHELIKYATNNILKSNIFGETYKTGRKKNSMGGKCIKFKEELQKNMNKELYDLIKSVSDKYVSTNSNKKPFFPMESNLLS